jgi:hypothetical protein
MLGHEDWFTRKNAIDALEFAAEPEDDAVMTALSLSMQDVSATVRYGRSRGARVSRGRVLPRSCLASCPRLTASSSSSPRPLCLLLFCLTGSRQYRVLCSLRESERMPSTRCAHLAFSPSDGVMLLSLRGALCVSTNLPCVSSLITFLRCLFFHQFPPFVLHQLLERLCDQDSRVRTSAADGEPCMRPPNRPSAQHFRQPL